MADRDKLITAYEHLRKAERLIQDAVDADDGTGYGSVGFILTRVNQQIAERRHTVFRFARGHQQRVAQTTPSGG